MDTILLALDTSTTDTGFAVFKNAEYSESGAITLDSKEWSDSEERVKEMIRLIEQQALHYSPAIVAIELPALIRNPKTQRELTMICGAVLGFCIDHGIFFRSFRPSEWRAKVKKDGEKLPRDRKGLKAWALAAVQERYGIELTNDNIAEAILIGEAYIEDFMEDEKDES